MTSENVKKTEIVDRSKSVIPYWPCRWIKCTLNFNLPVVWSMKRTRRSSVSVWATTRYV